MVKSSKTKTKTAAKGSEGKAKIAASKQKRWEIVRNEILDARRRIDSVYLDLAKLLHEVWSNRFYEKWNHSTLEEYCHKELDMKYRRARYLVDIYDKVLSLDLPRDQVEALGWTKMKEVARVIDKKNVKEWMEKAKDMTASELEEAVKTVKRKDVTGDAKIPVVTTMTFKMSEAESNVITGGIEEAKKLCDTENAVVALEMICQDWLMDKGVQPTRTTLEDQIQYLEKMYDVTITATKVEKTKNEKETKEILDEAADGEADISDILGLEDSPPEAEEEE